MDGGDSSPMRFIVFPWLAFGHLIPFLHLCKSLARRGHYVTFISTPKNVHRMLPVPSGLTERLRLVALPLPHVDGVPVGAESTMDLSTEILPRFRLAFDGLADPFSEFLDAECAAGSKPDWIVLDIFQPWLPPIARKHGVPCTMFLSTAAVMIVLTGPVSRLKEGRRAPEEFLVSPPWVPATSKGVAFRRPFDAAVFTDIAYDDYGTGVTETQRCIQALEGCVFVTVRSCYKLEEQWFSLLNDIFERPVVPMGLLLMSPDEHQNPAAGSFTAASAPEIMAWLDVQPAKSVVYIAMGSEHQISNRLRHELALGVELSGVRFLWALRKPKDADVDDTLPIVPDGFENRTALQGRVEMGWVPQLKILAHNSVGAFMTHCGWGSTIEGLRFGLPLIMLPILLDQPINSQIMEEKGVGAEVPRDANDGTFDRHGVADTVRRVMGDKEMARKAAELSKEVFNNWKMQEEEFDKFVEYLRIHKMNTSPASGTNMDLK